MFTNGEVNPFDKKTDRIIIIIIIVTIQIPSGYDIIPIPL